MKRDLPRILRVVAAALLLAAACTNRWLDHDDDQLGLLGLRGHTMWIWHGRWIEVAREMNEPLARMVTFAISGIVTLIASAVASVALVATSLRSARWIRLLALAAVIIAIVALLVFLATKPELEDAAVSQYMIHAPSRYLPSWSLIAFAAGVVAALVGLNATRRG